MPKLIDLDSLISCKIIHLSFIISLGVLGFWGFAFFSIPYKIHYPCNVSGMFGILTILSHAHSRFTIQDNQSSFLWNYVWILVQKFMN